MFVCPKCHSEGVKSTNRNLCVSCRRQYNSEYTLVRYHTRRAECLKILGSKCVKCGTAEALEIDHINPDEKTLSLGRMLSRPWRVVLEELRKCQLLCKSCHKSKSVLYNSVEHGEGKSGKKNCACALCRDKKAQYMREYKRLRRRQ
jgi:hypothetical protein